MHSHEGQGLDAAQLDAARLNAAQREAVLHTEGAMLVLAGAGSGKTRVITYRIAHLIESGAAAPDEILGLTFTNKAAAEMKLRATELVGPKAAAVTLSTFHSACARWLRRYARRAGRNAAFSILDSDDQLAAIRAAADRINLPCDQTQARTYRNAIETFQHRAMRVKEVHERASGPYAESVAELFEAYQDDLKRSNSVDFGGLIVSIVHLLTDDAELRKRFMEQYRYVMVDEFQDTNVAQYRLLGLLAPPGANAMVVGDDDQSIYRWRGASVENVRRYQRDYEGCKLVTLDTNYRSTEPILAAAHQVVCKLPDRMPKELKSARGSGRAPIFFVGADDREEAQYVASQIRRLRVDLNLKNSDFAIFYRTNAQTRVLEDRLRRAGVGYVIVAGMSFFERKEVKDLIAYLRLIFNPADDVAFRRIVNVPARGVGAKSLGAVEQWRRLYRLPNLMAASQVFGQDPAGPAVTGRASKAVHRFVALFAGLRLELESGTVGSLLDAIIELTDYNRFLTDADPETAEDRLRNVDELRNAAADFAERPGPAGVSEFLEYASLRGDTGKTNNDTEDTSRVQMMTVHASKGLEFPVVFCTGLEEDLFPLSRRSRPASVEELDEERRLCYVAFTRAEDLLVLTAARRRMLYGKQIASDPSRFLLDLQGTQIAQDPRSTGSLNWSAERAVSVARRPQFDEFDQRPPSERRARAPLRGSTAEPSDRVDLTGLVGKRARHKLFGVGHIVNAEPAGGRTKLTIVFPKVGEKKVVQKFVELLD